MASLEEVRAYFGKDHFATGQGITIDALLEGGGAVCSVTLEPRHQNALGNAQGGLVFTLADFAFAAAANALSPGTVTLQCQINYLRPATGGKLTATAIPRSRGKTICLYEVRVTDEAGAEVVLVTATGYNTRGKK